MGLLDKESIYSNLFLLAKIKEHWLRVLLFRKVGLVY